MQESEQDKPFREKMEEWLESGTKGKHAINARMRGNYLALFLISAVFIIIVMALFGRGACYHPAALHQNPGYQYGPLHSSNYETSPPVEPLHQLSASVSGSSQSAEAISLNAGVAVFHISGTSRSGGLDSNFIVFLKDAQGRDLELLANEIGYCEVSKVTSIPYTGQYFLDIMCNGPWQISWE
jgi:hypothetical protein